MFYQGSLQEGISTAVGQQKSVFCFVTNENEESKTWENDFLQDPSLVDVITRQAVALRLTAGSEEFGYLAQIFPIPQTPTIVMMKNGELKEYVAAGTTKEEFLRRIQNAFNISPPYTAQPASESLAPSPPTSSSPSGIPPTVERSDNVRRVLEERATRLKAAKAAAEQKAKEELARRKAKAAAEASQSAQKQAELVRKKKQQESEERRRILKRIQDDKAERRQQAAEREQQRKEMHSKIDPSSLPVDAASPSRVSSAAKNSHLTSIQVRLLDGSTIRSRFKTLDPVKEVRKWVDENRTDGEVPYTFTQLLTPLPNRSIDETEEEMSLGEIGLSPSSTLILVHVPSYSAAYNGSSQGFFSWIMGSLLAFFTWFTALIGLGGDSGHDSVSEQSDSDSAQARRRHVRELENPHDRRRDHQLYNGNSLNFEPRPDEDEK